MLQKIMSGCAWIMLFTCIACNGTDSAPAEIVVVRDTLTPSLTPSITPTLTPTLTPSLTPTPIPSSTPSPTLTPAPTLTPSLTPTPVPTVTPSPFFGPEVLELGRSVENRPIEAVRFGLGERHIVFVGSLQGGYAPAGVEIAERLIDFLSATPDLVPPNATVYVVPDINPDGDVAVGRVRGRLNANGVDLNRNWDCLWSSRSTFGDTAVSGGSSPMSEPETQALADLILDTQPVAVVIWTARYAGGLASPGGCERSSPEATALALVFGRAAGYTAYEYELLPEGGLVEGDATNWLDTVGVPAINILLPSPLDPDWGNNLDGIEAVLAAYGK